MHGLLVAQILFVAVCRASLMAKFRGKNYINAALFESESCTYCDCEIRDKTFIAPKIIVACLKFVEAHIGTRPYRKNDAAEESISDVGKLLASPKVVKLWSNEYSSEEMYISLEQYYKNGTVKLSTVVNIITQWHARFTQIYYNINIKKEYINEVKSIGKSLWTDGAESKQCLKGMYLQIILHLFTVPEDQRKEAFYAIFGIHGSPPAAIPEYFEGIDKIWNLYRKEQINSYRTHYVSDTSVSVNYEDTILLSILLKYSAIPNFLCDPYDIDVIRGPTQLENAFDKIHAMNATETEKSWFWILSAKDPKNLEKLKSDFFMGQVTPSEKYSANTASVFTRFIFSLLYSRFDLMENVQRKEGDVMDLLLKSLTQSGLNYCLIGGILRFFELFIYTTDRVDWAVELAFEKMCTASYPKPNGDNTRTFCGSENTDRIVKLMSEPWQTSKAQSYWQSRVWENHAAERAQSIAERTGNHGELRRDKRKSRTIDETEQLRPL